MLIYFLRRVALTIPTFLALMFLTFVAIRLVPGDPVEVRTGEHGISPERLTMFRHQLGLDQPIWRQFLDLCLTGLSARRLRLVARRRSNKVLDEFFTLFPATIELSVFGHAVRHRARRPNGRGRGEPARLLVRSDG